MHARICKYEVHFGETQMFKNQFPSFPAYLRLTRRWGHQRLSEFLLSPDRSWPLAPLRRVYPPRPFVRGLNWWSLHYRAGYGAIGKTVDRFHMIQRHKKHWSFGIRSRRLAKKAERGLCFRGPWDAPSLIIFII
jgi:hypothetical protein